MTPFVESTIAALDACRTQSDYYRVQFDILKSATPKDFAALVEALPGHEWVAPYKQWLTMHDENVRLHHPLPSDYALVGGGEEASLYSEGSGREILVIGFCGRADLLFLPAATIMQYLSPDADLLVLRDPAKAGFAGGLAGYADTFDDMIDALGRAFDFTRYKRIRTIGTSGSGAAALAAGVLLAAERAVSVCGHLPSGRRRAHDLPHRIEDIIRGSPGSPERFYAVFGDQCERDHRNANEIARVFAVTLHPIRGMEEHNVIRRLHVEGRLAHLFGEVGLV
jgi:hypothetical protein